MRKRETVILVVMFFVIAYGVYDFFLSSPKKPSQIDTEKELELLNILVTDVTKNLAEEELSSADTYILTRAKAEWVEDPFFERRIPDMTPKATSSEAKEMAIDYSGYLEMDRKRIAIINGMDYQIGDELESSGYVVRGIYPTKVLIEIKGKQRRIIVPISEDLR